MQIQETASRRGGVASRLVGRTNVEAFQHLLEAAPYAMWLQDSDGRIMAANSSALRQYGYAVEDLATLKLADLAPDGQLPAAQRGVSDLCRHRRKDGSWLEVEVSVRPLETDDRCLLAVTARDLTHPRRTERRLADLIDSLDGIVWEADVRSFRFLYVSPQAERLLGYPVERWLEPTFWAEHIHPDDQTWAVAYCADATAACRDYEFEYRMVAADGRVVWLHDVVSVIVEDGEAVLLRGVMVDITARKKAEADRQRALELLQHVIDSIPAHVALVDADQRYRLVNRRYEEWFGPNVEKIIGSTVAEALGEQAYARMRPYIQQALAGHDVRYERPMDDLYGNEHWLEARYVPWVQADGAVRGFVTLLFDITDRKRAEWALARLNNELEQRVCERTADLTAALRELESFSYAVSHDLTAPLRALDGFSSILLDDCAQRLDETDRGYLLRIRAAAGRMSHLIDDLLKLSRLSRQEMRTTSTDLSRMAVEAMAELRRASPEREARVEIEPGLRVQGDAGLLRVALDNLLGNAWKYTRRQPFAHIRFGRGQHEGRQAYFVADNGVGFDMAYAGKLFGAFQRLHADAEFEGSGIGLATVLRIVRRHGGEIWAEAAPGKGATFWFTLGASFGPPGESTPIE